MENQSDENREKHQRRTHGTEAESALLVRFREQIPNGCSERPRQNKRDPEEQDRGGTREVLRKDR